VKSIYQKKGTGHLQLVSCCGPVDTLLVSCGHIVASSESSWNPLDHTARDDYILQLRHPNILACFARRNATCR
jgi:hypothetical protein